MNSTLQNFLKLHKAQNQADKILSDAGFTSEQIKGYSIDIPTHVNVPALPNLLYVIAQLHSTGEDPKKLGRLLELIENIEI